MFDDYIRSWKQWVYNFKTKTMQLLSWKTGSNKIISQFEVEHYRVVEYTSDRFTGVTLKPGPKWKRGTNVTPVLLDLEHAKSIARNYWISNASYTLINNFDLAVTVRIVSKTTGDPIPEVAPVMWWGTENIGDPRKLPKPTWKRPKN